MDFPRGTAMGRKRRKPKSQKQAEPPGVGRQEERDLWPHLTNPHGYRYYFHPKHHGAGHPTVSRWRPDVSRQEEFRVFENAAHLDLADTDGNLYNVHKADDGTVLELGVFHEQIARFWKPSVPREAWHGHPLWPVRAGGPSNLAKQANRPDKSVFDKFVELGVLSKVQSHRLNNARLI
jgi:hypothetical protein